MSLSQTNSPSPQTVNLAVRMPDFGKLFELIQENERLQSTQDGRSLKLDQLLHRYCTGCYENSPVEVGEAIHAEYRHLKSEVLGRYKNTLVAHFENTDLSGQVTGSDSNKLNAVHKIYQTMQGMLSKGEPLYNILQTSDMWNYGAVTFQPQAGSWSDMLIIEPSLLIDPVNKPSSANSERIQRVYINCNPECVPSLILEVLDNEFFSGKIHTIKTIDFSSDSPGKISKTRGDRLVFYLEPEALSVFSQFIADFSAKQENFRPGATPYFTKQLSPGISIGQEPMQTEKAGLATSFVTLRKDLLLKLCTRVALEICRSCDEAGKQQLNDIIDRKIIELNPGEEEGVQEDIQAIGEEVRNYILSGTWTRDSEMVLRSVLPEILKLSSAQNLPAEKLNTFLSEEATKLGIDPNNLHLNLTK